MSKKKSHYGKAGLVFEELEPRLLLSADPLAVATEASVAIVEELVLGDNEDQTMIVQSSIEQSFTSIRNELVIIDSRAPNYQQLHNDLIKAQQQGRNIHVVVLDAHRDGIEQINEALTSHNKLDAVHIVSHGDDGQLQLGATQLNKATLRERSGDIAQWRQTFTEGGDLLIYGCDLASTADGRLLVNALGYLTATDVAASDDLTGNKLLGGDWDLEYEAGDIETSVAFSDDIQQQWQGTLEGAAPAGAEQQQAAAEEQQQQQEQQAQLDAQQAALNEEQQKAAEQNTDEQQAVVKEEQRQEVVFIDESVTDFQVFIDDLQGNSDSTTTFDIYTLDGRSDGVEYIEAVLAEYDGVDAVHIYSHGDDASVKLGSTWLNPNNIEAYNYSLASWSNGLDADADILIYGCNLAATTNGEQFVSELAQLTGADVAASDDITGHESLSGDWVLEYNNGSIETNVAVSAEIQDNYTAVLATETVADDLSSGDFTGNTGTQLWTGDWIEVDGGGAGAATGNVVVTGGEIQIRAAGSSIAREVDLSTASSATFSFDFRTGSGIESADPDSMVIEVSDDGGSTWTTLEDINYLDGVNSGSKSYDISAYTAVDTQIRIRANNGYGGPDEFFYVDDVRIQYTTGTAPVITSNGGGAMAGVNVTEHTTAVTTVTTTHVDGDPITYSISGGADAGLFNIDSNAGVLTFATAPDFETPADANTNNVYEVTVQAEDTNGDTDTQAISVTVTNVNDAPGFSIGDGIVATDFGSGDDIGNSVAVQADGKILVAGRSYNGSDYDFSLTRYNADGSLDTSFNGDGKLTTDFGSGDDHSLSINVQADGKILAAGYSFNGTNYDFALVRYNADGTLDTSFSGDGMLTTAIGATGDIGYSVTLQADGKILVAGYSVSGLDKDFALVRYNTDGSLDTSFSGDGMLTTDFGSNEDIAYSVSLQTDGRILVAGQSENGGFNDIALARYNTDGSLDTSFSGDGMLTTAIGASAEVGYNVTVQPDGKILVAGFSHNGVDADFALVRYNTDGTLDTSFSADGKLTTDFGSGLDSGYDVTVQPDGKILVSGFSSNGSNYDFAVVRYNADGSLDTSFSSDGMLTTAIGTGDDIGQSIALQPDGKILVAGQSNNGVDKDIALVRYNTDGTLDLSFDPVTTLDGNPTFVEDGAAVVLDNDVDVSDAELDALNGGLGNYAGASLTLVRNGGASAADAFAFNDGNGITFSGGNLVKNSQVIASFDTTSTPGELVVTFTDVNGETPTSADVDNILRQLSYANSSDTPPASAQIDWSFDDGNTGGQGSGGALIASGSTVVNITATNDAPGATDDPLAFDAYLASLGPTGYWRFGESAGGVAVDQTGLNDGTYNGPTLGQAGAISADVNTALQFDGIDDHAEIPHDPAYLLDNGTVQLWFNTSDVTQRADLFSKDALGNVTGGHLSIYLDGTGNIETRLQSASASYVVNSTLPLVNNQWHHVAFTFGVGGMQLYVDGQLQDSDAYTGGLGATSGDVGNFEPIAIGASTQVSDTGLVTPLQDYYTGYMDEVALFAGALSADQIQNLYSGGLQNYTVLEDNTINVAAAEGVLINDYDQEGNPLTAVLVSGPTNAASFTLNPDGSFDYTPLANFSGTDTFTYMANDGGTNSNVATVTIMVNGDNDAPVNTVPGTQIVLEDTQTAIAGVSVADPDAGASLITTQLTVTNGVLDVTLSGAATISAGANSSNTLTISGNVTDINATLASLQYTGNSNVNGVAADTLTVVTNDLGNTGTGGAQSDTDNVQINITAVNDAPVARDDRIGLVFDGVDDYVRIGDYAGLNVTTNMTMEAWIKPTGLGTGSKMIINKEGEYELGITADTGEVKWAFDNIDPDWNWHNTGYFVQADEWTHLAVTYNNGVVNTYANGVLVDTYIGSGAIADNYLVMNELQIGGRENAVTQRFNGQIDEVRIWNTTRAQIDIQNDMNSLLTGIEAGLIGNWRFDEGSGTIVVDQSALGHDGTLADGVTVAEMPSWQGYVVSEDGTLNVSAVNGVLPNDYDIDGDTLTAVLVSAPSNAAAFTLNPDGSFSYTPTADFNGIDSFTYMANDGSDNSNVATVTIRVDPVNDAPQATNLNAAETYTEDTALNLTDIVVSDVDSANVTVTLTLSDVTAGSLNTGTSGTVTSTFAGGVWTASGAIADVNTLLAGLTFTPTLNYNSNFTIATSVSDGVAPAITGSKAMTGTPVNDVPQATNLSAAETYTEDTALNLTDIVVSDVDSANVTVTLTLSDVTAGSLNTGTSGTVTSTFAGGVWTANGAITDVNTLLAGLTFTPSLNYNSNFNIATSVSDGVAPAVTGSKAMTGTAVNDVPVANANTVTTAEDNAYTFSVADFTYSDVEGDSLVAARITNISLGGGTLTHSGGIAVANGNTLTAAQLNTLVYTPPASVNGLPLATFDFTVNDANAGVMTAQMSINVTAVNTAPTATNLSAAETYTEDTALNLTDIVVSDVDSANVTVTLTLSDVTAGSLNTGTSGTVTSTFAGGVWTANGAITDVNTLLAGLTFTPSLNYNSNFTIATSVSDGVAPAVTGNKAMTGTPVNDVPQATNLNAAETYTEDTALNLTDIVVSDVDSANVTVTLTLSDVTAGSLNTGTSGAVTSTFVGGVWTASGAIADVNSLLAGLTFTPTLNYNSNFSIATSVSDGVAPAITGSKAMTGTAVNDVPVANANTVTTAEDNAYTFNVTDFTYSDVEGDSLVAARITNISLGGGALTHSGGIAVANGNTLTAAQLNTLVYTPPASTNGLPLATFDFTVNDASAGVMIAQMSINVTAVNTAPTATNLSAAETYTEDTALNLTDIVVSDVDSANVTVTLTLSDVTAGSLSTGTSGAVTSTFVGGVWTASGAIADVNTLLAGLTFTPTLDYNSNFTIATSVSDGVAPALTGSKAMTGTAVNDAPTMLFPSTVQTTNENTPLVFSTANGNQIAVGDIDANGNDLLINFLSLNGTLTLNGTVGLTFVTGDGVADTAMEFTGSIADINAALEGLIFTPDADFNGGTNFQMWVDDQGNTGSGGPEQTNRAALISVTPVNDPPTATNLSAAETYTEDTALNLTDIVVSDVDSANVTVTLTLSDVTAGSLNTGTSGAVTSTFVGGVWTASGAIADVNTLLAGLTFTPALDYNSNFTIATSVSDGVAPAISGSKVMTGTAVNDVPVATANTVSTTEDSAFNFASTDFIFTDVEGNSLVSATITGLNLASGTLTHSGGTAVTNGMTLTAAELDTLIYTPATNANGTPLASFNFTVNDAGAGAVSAQMSINVTAQPDAAVIAGVDTGVVTEDVDPDLDNLLEVSGSLTILDPDAGEALFNVGVFGGTYGVITLNAAGDWDYAANTNQAAIQNLAAGASLTDTITILSVDGTTHDINITIMGTNDAPVAGNDVVAVNEGSFVIIDVAATDSDIDNAIDLNSIIITGLPVNGAVVVNGDGTITYTHNGSETLLDSFTYTISDISGAISNSATVTVTVNPVNDPPVAGDDTTTVVEGNAVLIDLAANDSDADNALDLNSISIIGAPANGLLAINGDGTVTYTHDGSNTVSDLFTYTISDISGAISNTATVNITVTPVNNAPTTSGISNVTVNEDSANATIDLNAAFDDSDNLDSELAYSIVGNTNIGLFSVTGIDGTTGQLTLDYAANMNGSAQISVRATDPSGLSVDTLFTVTVTPVNDAPVMQANAGMLATGTAPGTITNSELNVTDIDNVSSEIAYMVTALPANGTLLLNGVAMAMNDTFTQADLDNNLLVYQSAGTAVSDQFGFAVADGSGGTLSNNTFDIIVQLGDDDGDTDTGITDTESDPEEEETEEEATEDSGGASDGAGGYGGGYVPFGGTTAPQKPSPALSIDPTPVKKQAQAVEEKDPVVAEVKDTRVTTFSGVQVKSMEALWSAIDQMKQEMGNSAEDKMSSVEIKAAAAKSSGVVLTAGVVAWILRSGALLSSLMSTIPLWKGYDPLPILAYKDDEEKEDEIHEDKIPTSLEELKKLKKVKEKKANEVDVDSIFGGSAIRE